MNPTAVLGRVLMIVGGASIAWCVDHAIPGASTWKHVLAFFAIMGCYDGGARLLRRPRSATP